MTAHPARSTVSAAEPVGGTVMVWAAAGGPVCAAGSGACWCLRWPVTTRPEPAIVGRFMTLEQVADELAVSRAQVYAMVRDRTLLALKVGGRGKWRVERSELEAYIARLYQEARVRPAVKVDEDDDAVHPHSDGQFRYDGLSG